MNRRDRRGGVLTAPGPEKDRQPRGRAVQEEKWLLAVAPGIPSSLGQYLLQTHIHTSASRRAQVFGGAEFLTRNREVMGGPIPLPLDSWLACPTAA